MLVSGFAPRSVSRPVSPSSYSTPSLDALYADRDEQVYFDETTVLDYPAVSANTIEREDGHCVLHVGITDTVAYAATQLEHPTEAVRTLRK